VPQVFFFFLVLSFLLWVCPRATAHLFRGVASPPPYALIDSLESPPGFRIPNLPGFRPVMGFTFGPLVGNYLPVTPILFFLLSLYFTDSPVFTCSLYRPFIMKTRSATTHEYCRLPGGWSVLDHCTVSGPCRPLPRRQKRLNPLSAPFLSRPPLRCAPFLGSLADPPFSRYVPSLSLLFVLQDCGQPSSRTPLWASMCRMIFF